MSEELSEELGLAANAFDPTEEARGDLQSAVKGYMARGGGTALRGWSASGAAHPSWKRVRSRLG